MLRFVSTVANGFAFQGSATDWWATPCYAVSQQGTCTCAVHVVVTLVFAVTSTQQWLCIPQWWLNRVSFDFLSNKRHLSGIAKNAIENFMLCQTIVHACAAVTFQTEVNDIIFCCGQCDLVGQNINTSMLNSFCRQHKFIAWFPTSAKDDINIGRSMYMYLHVFIVIHVHIPSSTLVSDLLYEHSFHPQCWIIYIYRVTPWKHLLFLLVEQMNPYSI